MPQDFSQSMAEDPIVKQYRDELRRMRFSKRLMWGATVFNFVAATANILSILEVI